MIPVFIKAPPIHDISTDTRMPPQFIAAKRRRRRFQNSLDYGGDRIARLQQMAYPDIRPVDSPLPPAEVYAGIKRIIAGLGWNLLDEDPASGRIEAVDTTRIFRFKDDIVIRIRQQEDGCRIDARSVSRIGRGDLGANAKRLRKFITACNRELSNVGPHLIKR